MEINISALMGVSLWPFSGSQATHGENAGSNTYRAALDSGIKLLTTKEQVERVRGMLLDMGMQDIEEDTPEQINAAFLQLIAAELRESGFVDLEDMHDTRGVEEYDKMSVFFGTDGEYYYQVG